MGHLFFEHVLLLLVAFVIGAVLGVLAKIIRRQTHSKSSVANSGADNQASKLYADESLEEEFNTKKGSQFPDQKLHSSDDPSRSRLYAEEENSVVAVQNTEDETGSDEDTSKYAHEDEGDDDYEELEIETEAYGLLEPRDGIADDLTLIKGIGPKINEILNELGVFHFDQIASWGTAEVTGVNEFLNSSGRIEREKWVTQAQALVEGEQATSRE